VAAHKEMMKEKNQKKLKVKREAFLLFFMWTPLGKWRGEIENKNGQIKN